MFCDATCFSKDGDVLKCFYGDVGEEGRDAVCACVGWFRDVSWDGVFMSGFV